MAASADWNTLRVLGCPLVDVFVSYERHDAGRARTVVEALRAHDLEVWWDQGIQSGSQWRADIENNLADARVVVCLWSKTSTTSTFVLDEARYASERGALCPVLIDDVRIPLGFGEVQAANLIGWSGSRRDPAWQYLIDSVQARLSGASPPERLPPKPRKPVLPITLSALGAIAALLTIVVTSEQLGWTDVIPHFPPPGQGVPPPASPAEQTAWRAASERQDRCAAMREFLRLHPEGRYSSRAQTILASRAELPSQRWAPFSQPSLVTGSSNLSERISETRACHSAQQSARRNAQNGCEIYSGDSQRFRQVQVVLGELQCECRDHAIRFEGAGDVEPIWRCTVRTTYHCRGEMMEASVTESCGAP